MLRLALVLSQHVVVLINDLTSLDCRPKDHRPSLRVSAEIDEDIDLCIAEHALQFTAIILPRDRLWALERAIQAPPFDEALAQAHVHEAGPKEHPHVRRQALDIALAR